MQTQTNEYGIKTFSGWEFSPQGYTEKKMTGEVGDKPSAVHSRWDREIHAAKGLVVESQWRDLEQHCDVTKLKEMALIGPDLDTHLSESKSAVIYPVDCDWRVLSALKLKLRNLPSLTQQRVAGICDGEFFRWVKFSDLIKQGVNYLDFDSMSVGLQDVVGKIHDGLEKAVEDSPQPFFIIRITLIKEVRGSITFMWYLEEALEKLGFKNIPPESQVRKQIPLGPHSWIEPTGKDYLYKNEGRRCTMITTQYIRNN